MEHKDFPKTYIIIIVILVTVTTAFCAPHRRSSPSCTCDGIFQISESEKAFRNTRATPERPHQAFNRDSFLQALKRSLRITDTKLDCWDEIYKDAHGIKQFTENNDTRRIKFTKVLKKTRHWKGFYKLTCDLENFIDYYRNETMNKSFAYGRENCRSSLLKDQFVSLKQVSNDMRELLNITQHNRTGFKDNCFNDTRTKKYRSKLNGLIQNEYNYTDIARIDQIVRTISINLIKKMKKKAENRKKDGSRKKLLQFKRDKYHTTKKSGHKKRKTVPKLNKRVLNTTI